MSCWHPNAPSGLFDHARHVFIKATELPYPFMGLPLVDFITTLRGLNPDEIRADSIEPTKWIHSLITALHAPLTDKPIDELGRSPLDLLNHLACDGNRFVRWAARTRLTDPDFVFTWHDEDNKI